MKGFVVSSIPTTHLVAGSFFSHSTFIVESIGNLRRCQNTSLSLETFPATVSTLIDDHTIRIASLVPDLSSHSNLSVRRSATRRHTRHFSLAASPMHWRVKALGPTSGDGAPPATSPTVDLSPCHLASPLWCKKKCHFFPFFSSATGSRAFLLP